MQKLQVGQDLAVMRWLPSVPAMDSPGSNYGEISRLAVCSTKNPAKWGNFVDSSLDSSRQIVMMWEVKRFAQQTDATSWLSSPNLQ